MALSTEIKEKMFMENYTEGGVYVSQYSSNRGGGRGGSGCLYRIKETKIYFL